MSVRHKVLVIDTGDPLIKIAEATARELGHAVFCHPSPVGAGTALAQQEADTVILSWDLAAAQDAKLIALIESWERFRQLKTIVLSSSQVRRLATLLHGTGDRIVMGIDNLEMQLEAVLGQPSGEVGAVSSGRGEQGLFATRLRRRLSEASQVWENIAQGAASHREMDFLLGAIHGQAQLLRWDKVARLIAETRNVLKDSMGESLRIEQYEAVGAALRFCVQASAAPPYDSDRDVEPMLLRLRRTRQR